MARKTRRIGGRRRRKGRRGTLSATRRHAARTASRINKHIHAAERILVKATGKGLGVVLKPRAGKIPGKSTIKKLLKKAKLGGANTTNYQRYRNTGVTPSRPASVRTSSPTKSKKAGRRRR